MAQTMTIPREDDRFAGFWINLADDRLGTKVLACTDDFFAEKENLILPGRGVFIPGKYTDKGKWMDGWESRRKRVPGHDWCDIRLGARGVISGFDIDTNHFLGNHPPHASVEACLLKSGDPDKNTTWIEILPKSPLSPGGQNLFDVQNKEEWSHVRLHIYPDGGVARFRVYGTVAVDTTAHKNAKEVDLVSVKNGGRALICNDMFFSDKNNLLFPGRGKDMGDGWETRRRRTPGNDWVVLALGFEGMVKKIELDTAHFKGNFPDRASIEGVRLEQNGQARGEIPNYETLPWRTILPETKLQADKVHLFEKEIQDIGPITHARLNIYPDGGVSRLRLWGQWT